MWALPFPSSRNFEFHTPRLKPAMPPAAASPGDGLRRGTAGEAPRSEKRPRESQGLDSESGSDGGSGSDSDGDFVRLMAAPPPPPSFKFNLLQEYFLGLRIIGRILLSYRGFTWWIGLQRFEGDRVPAAADQGRGGQGGPEDVRADHRQVTTNPEGSLAITFLNLLYFRINLV